MKAPALLRVLAIALLAMLTLSSLALAQATRTWVSGVGDDANPCSRTAPCKTFAGAIAKTAPGGEIDVLDPGGFGALTITKSISIEADGLIAGVLVSGTNGFVVSAGVNDVVMIRGLTFEGLGTGLTGISILQAGKVFIQDCHINGFTNFGIDFKPPNNGSQLFVTNTTVRNNGNFTANSGGGIIVEPTATGGVTATLNNVNMYSNIFGLQVRDGSDVVAKSSIASDNKFAGFNLSVTTVAANLFVDQVVSFSNGTVGLQSQGTGATARMTQSSFTGNGTGVSQLTGGILGSFSNNYIAGNTSDIVGTITPIAVH